MRLVPRIAAAVVCCFTVVAPLGAQADTISARPFFTWRDVAILEAFAIATVAVAPLDRKWANHLQDSTVQDNRAMKDVATFVETVADPGAALGVDRVGCYDAADLR